LRGGAEALVTQLVLPSERHRGEGDQPLFGGGGGFKMKNAVRESASNDIDVVLLKADFEVRKPALKKRVA